MWGSHIQKKEAETGKQLLISASLIVVSTLCYYIPTMVASSKGIDLKEIPFEYYRHHIWRSSGAFLMTSVYALCFFIFVPERLLTLKLFSCYLFFAESYTFIDHVISMFFIRSGYSFLNISLTLISFSVCVVYLLYRSVKKPSSCKFNPQKTYVIKYLPKDLIGFFNYVLKYAGHKAIYQNGKVYGFKKSTGKIEGVPVAGRYFKREDISINKIDSVNDIESFIGNKFSVLFYNCNHFIKNAQAK